MLPLLYFLREKAHPCHVIGNTSLCASCLRNHSVGIIKLMSLLLKFSSTEQVHAVDVVQFKSQLDQRECNNKTVASAKYILGYLTVSKFNEMRHFWFPL